LGIILASAVALRPALSAQAPRVQYKVTSLIIGTGMHPIDVVQQKLDELGNEGWSLVYIEWLRTGVPTVYLVLRR